MGSIPFLQADQATSPENFYDSLRAMFLLRKKGRIVMRLWIKCALLGVSLTCFLLTPARLSARNATESKTTTVAIGEGNAVQAEFQVGPEKIRLEFKFVEGPKQILEGQIVSDMLTRQVTVEGKKSTESTTLPDAAIEFKGAGLNFQCHARPYLKRYTEAQREDLVKRWDKLPAASEQTIRLEIRQVQAGVQLWLQGRYCGTLQSKSPFQELTITNIGGGNVSKDRSLKLADQSKFLTLDIPWIAQRNLMTGAKLSTTEGIPRDVPLGIAPQGANADVGVVKLMQGLKSLETNEFTSRTSLDGMPEALHFSVPQEFYRRAWLLCAIDPDPKKDTILTVRLTRYGISGRGGAMADTLITFPRGEEKPADGIKRVGEVKYPTPQGEQAVPLYLVEVSLRSGEILDLLTDETDRFAAMKIGPYLDFDLLGKCGVIEVQTDRRRMPDNRSTSAVHVFAATLERSPVELRLKQSQPGNIFHNDETPETSFFVKAHEAGEYTLESTIRDLAGRVLNVECKTWEYEQAEEREFTVSLKRPELGWYGLEIVLKNQRGEVLLKHDAAFALLGKDTRTAGYESPFGTWWFAGIHNTTREKDTIGPMLFKAGMRRTTFYWSQHTEQDFEPWKVSLNQVKWPFRLIDLQDWPAAEARAEKEITALLQRFPHCQYVDIFHESYAPGMYPPELYDEKYQAPGPAELQREDQLHELGVKAATFLRAKFPQLKRIVGNSGGSAGMVAILLRRGFPADLIDYFGSETTGQTFAPEKLTLHTTGGIFLLGETGRKFGYDKPLTGCFEYTCRADRDLGARRQAEWYARDILIGLAHGFQTVSPAVIEDVGNAYHDTLWGASGLCQRAPLHYPKPSYVALATITKVLDGAKFVRQMPTGSASVYALEFQRGKDFVYAFWTPRGDCVMKPEFPKPWLYQLHGLFGSAPEVRTPGQLAEVVATPEVQFIVSTVALDKFQYSHRKKIPVRETPESLEGLNAFDQWQLAPGEPLLKTTLRRPGEFKLKKVSDWVTGTSLELELQPTGQVPALVGEYATLRLKQSPAIPEKTHTLGLWVDGNSSGGRIIWELEDAKGEIWRSNGGVDGGDWADQSTINFDGWVFVTFPLTEASPFNHLEPGRGLGQWTSNGDHKLDHPVKVRGLHVVTHRKTVNLTRLEPVTGNIRLKGLSAISQ